jgi:hypothetical protein
MVPLLMEMRYIFSDRPAQRTLPEQHQTGIPLSPNAPGRKGIQIRTFRRQFERFHSARPYGVAE